MDKETKDAFKDLGGKMDSIHTDLSTHIAYDKGLELPKRMGRAERDIRKKASWAALATGIFVLCVLIGGAIAIAQGIN